MFCPSCGVALSQQLKYCNHCGAHLAPSKDAVAKAEKRLDEYLDGLFWITVFGLGLILGGIALLQKLQVGPALMIGYLALSSSAFLINFWLSLREIFRIRSSREPKVPDQLEQFSPAELRPMNAQATLQASPSVTENTTRELQSNSKKNIRG